MVRGSAVHLQVNVILEEITEVLCTEILASFVINAIAFIVWQC